VELSARASLIGQGLLATPDLVERLFLPTWRERIPKKSRPK
jgi:hypothetical protein